MTDGGYRGIIFQMNKKVYDYKVVTRLNLSDPKQKTLVKLNTFAVISIMVVCAVGLILNYCLRMLGNAGGMYFVYILCGFVCCLIYPFVHEFAHAFAVLICRGKLPTVRFGKFAAYCGSPDIIFNKIQYFFVAAFPFVFYGAVLVPLCVYLPAEFFAIPFMPAVYNVFGSVADAFMIRKALASPKRCIIVDGGTDVVIYTPVGSN